MIEFKMCKDKKSWSPSIIGFLKVAVGFVLLLCIIAITIFMILVVMELVKTGVHGRFPWKFTQHFITVRFVRCAVLLSAFVFAIAIFRDQIRELLSVLSLVILRIQSFEFLGNKLSFPSVPELLTKFKIETRSEIDEQMPVDSNSKRPKEIKPPTPWEEYRRIENAALMLLGNNYGVIFQQGVKIKGFPEMIFDGVGIKEKELYIAEIKITNRIIETQFAHVCRAIEHGLKTVNSSCRVKFIVGVVGDNEDIMNAAFKSRVSEMCSPDIDVEFHFLKRNNVETIAKCLEDR